MRSDHDQNGGVKASEGAFPQTSLAIFSKLKADLLQIEGWR